MARLPRKYRAPIVITLATTLGAACGGQADYTTDNEETGVDGPGSGGLDATSGGTDTSSGGLFPGTGAYPGSGGVTGSGGFMGSGGNPPKPEAACPTYLEQTACDPFELCTRTSSCTSGEERAFWFTCEESGTTRTLVDPTCANPFEFCNGEGGPIVCTEDGVWQLEGVGGNPPAPCPETAPTLGATCSPGNSFGADRSQCGYTCESGDWTIIGCVLQAGADPPSGTWQSDGACPTTDGDTAGETD